MLGSPVLDVSLGKADAVDNCLNEMFGTKREKKVQVFRQLDEYLPPEKPTAWVQCERCLKWRRVPFHVKMDTFPDQWYCEYNTWDEIEKINCDYPQDNFDSEKEAIITQQRHAVELVNIGDWNYVYCIRNHVYYEAKAVQKRTKKALTINEEDKVEFRFHFRGWKSNQDEWIESGSNRIAPHHLYTDATSKNIKDQEKWQGFIEPIIVVENKSPIKLPEKKKSNQYKQVKQGKRKDSSSGSSNSNQVVKSSTNSKKRARQHSHSNE